MIEKVKQKLRNRKNKDPWAEYEREVRALYGHEDRDRGGKLARVGKTIGGLALGVGAIVGVAELSSAEVNSHTKEMNEKFEPILKPAAESVADLALDKVAAMDKDALPSEGYITPVDDDPGKFHVHYEGTSEGATYELDAIVGKDAEGKPDASKVTFAEIDLESEGFGSSDTIRETYNDFDYWGGASASAHGDSSEAGGGYTTYSNLDTDPNAIEKEVDTARSIAGDVEREVENIRAGIYPFK